MVNASIEQQIRESLDKMPEPQQQRVADYAKSMASGLGPGVTLDEFLKFSGNWDPADLEAIQAAIEEDSENIDLSEW